MTLSEKIVFLRRQKNWSQEELALQLDVARQSISKWESGQSLPELDKLVRMSELFGVSLDLLVKDSEELSDGAQVTDDRASPDGAPSARCVYTDEANEFLAFRRRSSRMIALGVLLCILSPICLLLLTALAGEEAAVISENMAVIWGLIAIFLLVTPAVVLFVVVGMQGEPYACLTQADFVLAHAAEADVRAQKMASRRERTVGYATATALCILSPIPLLYASLVWQKPLPVMLGVICILVLAGLGASLFTLMGVRQSSYDLLLHEGEYQTKKSRREEAISSAYWLVVTAVYLAVSFAFDSWHISWVIWVAASVLFGAFEAILHNFVFDGKSKKE